MATETAIARTAQAGKFLAFALGREEYGLEILKVHEIIGPTAIRRLQGAPEYLHGVVQLRGRTIPIVSLRHKFNMGATEDTEKTCIIVAHVQRDDRNITMGVLVDEVTEVMKFGDRQIVEFATDGDAGEPVDCFAGVGKVGKRRVKLLDLDQLFSVDEIEAATRLHSCRCSATELDT